MTNKKINYYLLALLLMFFSNNLWAGGSYWGRIHRPYQSARSLGMGDAFVAVSDDYSSLFYNPAGLARLKSSQVNMSLDASLTSSFMDFYTELDRIGQIQDINLQTSSYIAFFQKNYGNIYAGRFGLFHGIWVKPKWGFAIIPADTTVEMTVHNQSFPSISTRMIADTTIALGYGDHIRNDNLGGKASWGVTGKIINRVSLNADLNVADLVLDDAVFRKSEMVEGATLDADVGLLYSPFLAESGFWSVISLARPTFGVVARNVLGGEFKNSLNLLGNNSTGRPDRLETVFDIGSKWEYPELFIFSGRGVMDFKNIGHSQYSFKKGLHLGFEFDWRMASWWNGQYRIGLSQGYLTSGLSALLGVFRLDLVTYGEEVGTDSSPKESRSYMVRLNIDF